MDPRLKNISENFESMKIGIDEPFRFNCTQCGQCCINRQDILITPRDLFRMSKELGLSPLDFIKKYCDTYLGSSSHIPLVRIVPQDFDGRCPMLNANRQCAVHQVKPTVCALFPIGRAIIYTAQKKEPEKNEGSPIQYIFTAPECGDGKVTHTVREWLSKFNIPLDDSFFLEWQEIVCQVGGMVRNALKKYKTDEMNRIINIIFFKLYLDYDLNKGFDLQFSANSDKIVDFMKSLTNNGGNENA